MAVDAAYNPDIASVQPTTSLTTPDSLSHPTNSDQATSSKATTRAEDSGVANSVLVFDYIILDAALPTVNIRINHSQAKFMLHLPLLPNSVSCNCNNQNTVLCFACWWL